MHIEQLVRRFAEINRKCVAAILWYVTNEGIPALDGVGHACPLANLSALIRHGEKVYDTLQLLERLDEGRSRQCMAVRRHSLKVKAKPSLLATNLRADHVRLGSPFLLDRLYLV